MSGETVIAVIGNIVADPELRYTQSGAAVVSFTVASTSRKFDKASGEWQDGEALFMRCSAWRQMAENVAESLVRGSRVMVQGRLVQRSFQTKEGDKRTVVELDVDEVGPSLRYATAKVQKASREGGSNGQYSHPNKAAAPADDPWAATPVATGGGGGFGEEPPFVTPRDDTNWGGSGRLLRRH